MPDGSVGLFNLPRPGEPESNLLSGMSAVKPLGSPGSEIHAPIQLSTLSPGFGLNPNANITDTSGPANTLQLQQPAAWNYDFDPATGISRATYVGEVSFSGGGGTGQFQAIGVNNAVPLAGGVNFGSVLDSSNTSFVNHLSLFGGQYGIGVTTSRLNIVHAGNVFINNGGTDQVELGGVGINSLGQLPIQAGSGTGNALKLTPATAGNPPTVQSISGGDANVGVNYQTVGTGSHAFFIGATGTFSVNNGSASTSNLAFLQSGSNTASNNVLRLNPTVAGSDPSLSIVGPDANRGLNIVTNGTGTVYYKGTGTNDNAPAGDVGEFVTATGTSVAIANGTPTNCTSISLTAGDWDVWGAITFIPTATQFTQVTAGGSTTSATLPAVPAGGVSVLTVGSAGNYSNTSMPVYQFRLSIASVTTMFLVGQCSFTGGSAVMTGIISARRRR